MWKIAGYPNKSARAADEGSASHDAFPCEAASPRKAEGSRHNPPFSPPFEQPPVFEYSALWCGGNWEGSLGGGGGRGEGGKGGGRRKRADALPFGGLKPPMAEYLRPLLLQRSACSSRPGWKPWTLEYLRPLLLQRSANSLNHLKTFTRFTPHSIYEAGGSHSPNRPGSGGL